MNRIETSYSVSDINRHWLIYLKQNSIVNTDHKERVTEWIGNRQPFVCARFDKSEPNKINLGICIKNDEKEKAARISVSSNSSNIEYFRPPLLLREVIDLSDDENSDDLKELFARIRIFDLPEPAVFGSYAWQALMKGYSQQKYITENSDLDLCVQLLRFEEISLYKLVVDNFYKEYKRRVDCEIYYPEIGYFSLNEFFSYSKDILIKKKYDVELLNKKKLYQILLDNAYFETPVKVDLTSYTDEKEVKKIIAEKISTEAVRALASELSCYPKPGLVSFFDSGAHTDMDYMTFMKSIDSLLPYFRKISLAVFDGLDFEYFEMLGREAELKMFEVTNGVNTYKGIIFSLGLLLVAVAELSRQKYFYNDNETTFFMIGELLNKKWKTKILQHCIKNRSHGKEIREKFKCSSILEEAANGFPVIFKKALPVFINYVEGENTGWNSIMIDTFFQILSYLNDTNILYRAGEVGLKSVRKISEDFLSSGGTSSPEWKNKALRIHQEFIDKNLSPGGCADMLACTVFVYRIMKIFS